MGVDVDPTSIHLVVVANTIRWPTMVEHACEPSTSNADQGANATGGSLGRKSSAGSSAVGGFSVSSRTTPSLLSGDSARISGLAGADMGSGKRGTMKASFTRPLPSSLIDSSPSQFV